MIGRGLENHQKSSDGIYGRSQVQRVTTVISLPGSLKLIL